MNLSLETSKNGYRLTLNCISQISRDNGSNLVELAGKKLVALVLKSWHEISYVVLLLVRVGGMS